jgi:hypothetical protein
LLTNSKFDTFGLEVGIGQIPAIPPEHQKEYDYWPRPAVQLPPVNPRLLAHYFRANCDGVDPGQRWILRSLPKLIDHALARRFCKLEDLQNYGWGIETVEEFDFDRIRLLAGLCLGVSFVITVVTVQGTRSLQTNFTGASSSLALCGLSIPIAYRYSTASHGPELFAQGFRQTSSTLQFVGVDPYVHTVIRRVRNGYIR